MPSLIEKLIESKQKDPALDQAIKDDVQKAEDLSTDFISRIANRVPDYLTPTEKENWINEFLNILSNANFVKFDNQDPRNIKDLIQIAIQTTDFQMHATPREIEKNPMEEANTILKGDEQTLELYKKLYAKMFKEIISQIMIVTPHGFQIKPEFTKAIGMQAVMEKMSKKSPDEQKKLVFHLIQSLTNQIIVASLLAMGHEKIGEDPNLRMRSYIAYEDFKRVTQDQKGHTESLNNIIEEMQLDKYSKEEIEGLLHKYINNYIVKHDHDPKAIKEILQNASPALLNEITGTDPDKHRSKTAMLFSKTQRQHAIGDQILSYAGKKFPRIAKQIFKGIEEYRIKAKNDPEIYVFAIKVLVRLGHPELAYQALYGDEATKTPKNLEEMRKAVKEKAIRAYLKKESKQEAEDLPRVPNVSGK